ncbi:hypothetical protein MMC12_007447 [Toensbergia leucococca]|nr:hypothetical protein [Toensbergia leucococca]
MYDCDFLIVGGGPSGCVLASRLARTSSSPKVLLVEAGSDNSDLEHQVSGQRYMTLKTAQGYNWGYDTVPQKQLNGQKIDYSRGRGLGGSSAINFLVYVRGPKHDYDEWANLVDDEAWSWEQTNRRFNKIETYHGEVSDEFKAYVNPSYESHGHDGPLDLGFSDTWEKDLKNLLDAARQCGHPLNTDLNDGNPIGVGIPASTAHRGRRVTAATAYLSNKPDNLKVITNTAVTNIIFQDKKAIGVQTSRQEFFASKEVILCAGALDSPKILLLSGIGPAKELEKFKIKVVHDVANIGQGLKDHCFAPLTLLQKPDTNDRAKFFTDPRAMEDARQEWLKDQSSGALAHFYCAVLVGFFKSERIRNSTEFQALPTSLQNYLHGDTVPDYEMTSHTPPLWVNENEVLKPADTYLSLLTFWMNPQSTGSLSLQSANPHDTLLIDPQFLSHPFDRRAAIEAIRHTMELIALPLVSKDTIKLVGGPKSSSDEDILTYIKSALFSSWHMCSTVKMGRPGEHGTCVNKNFQVVGVERLRVVDMSVAPIITNNHTQSVAYLIGETAAEKLINEYDLDTLSAKAVEL